MSNLTEKETMSEAWCDGYNTRELEIQAETANLSAQLEATRAALRELLESAKHAQMETHETFTSNTLFDAVVKAEKIFDTDADR